MDEFVFNSKIKWSSIEEIVGLNIICCLLSLVDENNTRDRSVEHNGMVVVVMRGEGLVFGIML